MADTLSMAKPIRKILIIRFRRVGDAVLSSVLCSSLRRSFPEAEIHYVLNSGIAPLFEGHSDIDKLITFSDHDQSSLVRYLCKVWRTVRSEHYDLIIDTRSTVKTLPFSLCSLRSPWRIGRRKAYNALLHTHRIPIGYQDEVTNTLRLLEPLERAYPMTLVRDFRLYTTDGEREHFIAKMRQHGIDLHRPIMLCTVTARLVHKVWSRDKMVETLRRVLMRYPEVQLVFNYAGERERANAYEIYEALGCDERIFIELEATSLREMLALLSCTTFMFGNEGGPRHIAQAMGVPCYAIYPPKTSKHVWLPNPSERVQGIELRDLDPQAADSEELSFAEKFDRITVDAVWAGLRPMLDSSLVVR